MATLTVALSQPFNLDTVYNPAAYNTLPSLQRAHSLITKDAMAKLQGRVWQVFLNHRMQDHHGVCLLHNHFQKSG